LSCIRGAPGSAVKTLTPEGVSYRFLECGGLPPLFAASWHHPNYTVIPSEARNPSSREIRK
jgi:hypothetical protein